MIFSNSDHTPPLSPKPTPEWPLLGGNYGGGLGDNGVGNDYHDIHEGGGGSGRDNDNIYRR